MAGKIRSCDKHPFLLFLKDLSKFTTLEKISVFVQRRAMNICGFTTFSKKLTSSMEIQLAECYQALVTGRTLVVKLLPAQIQQGGVDCGLLAIANAYELATGNDLLDISFDQGSFVFNYCAYCMTRYNKCGRIGTKWLFFFILIEECCAVIEKNIGKKLANRISYQRYLLGKFDGGRGGSKSVKGVQIRCYTGTRVNRL